MKKNEKTIENLNTNIGNLKEEISNYEKERPKLIENSKIPAQNKKKMEQMTEEINKLKKEYIFI